MINVEIDDIILIKIRKSPSYTQSFKVKSMDII